MILGHSLEKKFIISCLQTTNCDHARTKCNDMITRPLNWNFILGTVIRSKIASPLYEQLKLLGIDRQIPSGLQRQFKKYCYKIGYQNIQIFEQLVKLIQLLSDARVDVIVLKGAALQAEVWSDLSLREMADIDLLVRLEDLKVAEHILQKNGYLPDGGKNTAEYYRKYHHHLIPYYNPKAAYWVPIEIHHNIKQPIDPMLVDMSVFWESSRTITFNQTTFQVLSPENLLLHLCMDWSFNKIMLSQIRYLLDISRVVSHFGMALRWDRFLMAACIPGIANYIYYALYFSKILLGAAIPQKVLDRIGQEVSVKIISHHILRFLVKQNSLMSVTEISLIPLYKLRFICRDIVSGARVPEKVKTLWYDFLFPKVVTESGENVGPYRRLTFIGQQLAKNLFNRP